MENQINRFRKGFPWLEIVSSAKIGKGIKQVSESEIAESLDYLQKAEVKGKCKFIPASGAASRMFKDIFAGLEKPNEACQKLADNLEKMAFYTPEIFGNKPFDPQEVAAKLLTDKGLGYGSKPKGVLKFHRYANEVRTALAEHLVEGAAYMRNEDDSVNLVITISPDHLELFQTALEEIQKTYEERYHCRYNVQFTYQKKETDTIAVDKNNNPFLKEDGTILTRPAGHGALIYNLNEVKSELVSIKNIDNVCVESMQESTYLWKKVLMAQALILRDRIRGYIFALDQMTSMLKEQSDFSYIPVYNINQFDPFATDECQSLCNEIEDFLNTELCITIPSPKDSRDRAQKIRKVLNRPIRVCGMVRNEGEPGGGPFIIRDKNGFESLQILEAAQIDMSNSHYVNELKNATHFNPVDLVCCLQDYNGEKFNLLDYVDPDTGLISSKSYQGRELKALELPGLWNGSMSNWNTLFVEVPIDTFNPVKVVLDLLRPAHQ